MFYKKIHLPLLPFAGLLLGGECKQVPISSISDHKDNLQNNKVKRNKPQVSLFSCRSLGSLSCMGGAKEADFLLQVKGSISIDPQEGQVGFIWLSSGAASPNPSIINNAINAKGQVETLIPQDAGGGIYIYWDKISKIGTGTKEWIIQVGEEAYKKLTSNKYAMHMLCAPSGTSAPNYVVATTPFQMGITGKDQSLPDYRNIGLEAISVVERQQSNGPGWFLKGKIAGSFPADVKIGFILVQEGVNPYNLVQQVIASKEGWPTEATSFNDAMIIVPGTLRQMDPPIVGDLLSSQAPIQGGNFKILCYLIQNKHYYLSQMEHVLSDVSESSLSQESAPPSITFTGNRHGLKVSNLKLRREQVSGQVQNVKFSDFKVEYFINDQVEALPANLKPSVIFVPKGGIWRTLQLETLFKQSYESNSNAIVTDDGTICLVSDASKPLGKSCIDFFSRAADYGYFACLFSTEDHKLKFYTQKEEVSIEENEINKAQPPKLDELKIELDNTGANITLHQTGFFKWNYATFTPPKVSIEPNEFDKKEMMPRGFVIAEHLTSNSTKMDDYSSTIQNFINDKQKVSQSNKFIIFQEQLTQTQQDRLKQELYDACRKADGTLGIGYWAQYKNKIIWSKPVSIKLILQKD